MILTVKDKKRMLLITDSIRTTGLDNGYFDLGGQNVKVEDNKCMLEDGTIAGSVLKINEAAYNFYKHTDSNIEDIIPMITSNQAEYLGVNDKIGEIAVGKQADLVIMDEDFNILKTIVKGNIAYEI